MIVLRFLKWVGTTLLLLVLAGAASIAVFGWNWLREPVARVATDKTGRELRIDGNLQIDPGWPLLRIRATDVTLGNPAWASRPNMLTAGSVDLSLDLAHLLDRRVVLDVVALRQADILLETGSDGRRNWLFDLDQKDEATRPSIGRLALERSRVTYHDPANKTRIEADVTTRETQTADGAPATGVEISARGRYRGLPLTARAEGGPLLALRDERRPYPFAVEATIGRTAARVEGTVTGLARLSALDAEVSVRGDSLAQLYPLLGIALPKTPAYRSTGRLTHGEGMWRYADFFMHVGDSDLYGTLQVDTGGRRPFLHGDLRFGTLRLADLGPTIGTPAALPGAETPRRRVLPEVEFRAERWDSVDADVGLSARTIVRDRELPLDALAARLRLRDSVLTLDPLTFNVADGTIAGTVVLDGQRAPISARARLAARKLVLGQLLPAFRTDKANLGRVAGDIDLAGSGNSVARMLGSADGRVALLVDGGEVSRLMMETAGLHVLEIIALTIAGDRPVAIRCGLADFRAENGIMHVEQLVFDTAISNVGGRGRIDFRQENLDLTLEPRSKETNLIALRSPITVRGSFASPVVDVDKGRIAMRGLGALALGIANPFLALAPLVEAGPGMDSDCGRLIKEAEQPARGGKEGEKTAP